MLQKNRETQLSEGEEAELDDMEHINHLMTLLKAEARKFARRRLDSERHQITRVPLVSRLRAEKLQALGASRVSQGR